MTRPPAPSRTDRPLVLGHRGASGHRPENTLGALALALEQGADGVEVDVVPSRDGVLVVRHDAGLAATTDVAAHPGLAGRMRDGDWWTQDLDAAEIAVLRARERWPDLRPASAAHDGREAVPTLARVLDLVAAADALLVLEIKHAAAFAARDLDPAPLVAATLAAAPAVPRIVLESFEKTPLDALAGLGLPLVYLIDGHGSAPDEPAASYADELAGSAALADRGYAGVSLPVGVLSAPLVERLHDDGLSVWAWTLRPEARFLPPAEPSWPRHWASVVATGVDAVFADHPDLALGLLAEGVVTSAAGPAPPAR